MQVRATSPGLFLFPSTSQHRAYGRSSWADGTAVTQRAAASRGGCSFRPDDQGKGSADSIPLLTYPSRMMIGVLGSLAECARELTRQRTALKRAASRSSSQPSDDHALTAPTSANTRHTDL